MQIKKRDGSVEAVDFNKILKALTRFSENIPDIDPAKIAQKIVNGIYDGIATSQIDELAIQISASLIAEDPHYSKLAARLLTKLIQKEATANKNGIHSFSQSMQLAYEVGLINERLFTFVKKNARKLNDAIREERNELFEYFGLKTLYDRYFLKLPQCHVIETAQYLFMRVACAVSTNVKEAIEYYNLFSSLEYLPSTPTLFNAGTPHEQLSSCYLLDSPEDSLDGIYDRYKQIASLSKYAGGIGLSYSRVRSAGSSIRSTNGKSNGIVPWLKTLDSSVSAVNQGGRRKGAAAVYLETWHADIESFLELRDNTGDESRRTHNLNLAHWIPDLFMKRVEEDGEWSLFDPAIVPAFPDLYGTDFETAYIDAEQSHKFVKQIKARDLYGKMMRMLAQTGNGWICFKDVTNMKSNQTLLEKNMIHSSNLCVAPETLVLTDKGQFPIASLVNQEVNVWNGFEFSKTTIRKTGEHQKLLTLLFDDGQSLSCTQEHNFILHKHFDWSEGSNNSFTFTKAKELMIGDRLLRNRLPAYVFDENKNLSYDPHIVLYYNSPVLMQILTHRIDDTYCFTEPLRGLGTFNGIITGQCTEITEVTNQEEVAVCNLGSLNLSQYIKNDQHIKNEKIDNSKDYLLNRIDFVKLAKNVRLAVRQLDQVIDLNFYPIPEAKKSNAKWRPIGLGIMGLQDVFFKLRLPFDSEEAKFLSQHLQSFVYYHALKTSNELAIEKGAHATFKETRASLGQLQNDLWSDTQAFNTAAFDELKESIIQHGLRNSLLIAIAPTATIASIVGCYECMEPQLSNLFKRESLSGDFLQINKYLVQDLKDNHLWNESIKHQLRMGNGSIQNIPEIPQTLKQIYRTVWEIPMRSLIDMAADRGPYIDQSQSLNLFIENPNIGVMSSMYMYAWKKGLKTTYYLRSRPATQISKVNVEPMETGKTEKEIISCSLENPASCEACQ